MSSQNLGVRRNPRFRPIALFFIIPIAFIILFSFLPSPPVGSFWHDIVLFILLIVVFFEYVYFYHEDAEFLLKKLDAHSEGKPIFDEHFLSYWEPEDALTEFSYIEKIGYIVFPVMIFIVFISEIGR